MKKKYLLLILVSNLFFSQTTEERKKISQESNKEGNLALFKELFKEESDRKIRLNDFLLKHPDFKKVVKDKEFGTKELIDVKPDGELVYVKTYNPGAAITARANKLYNGGGFGTNIQGQGMIAGIWDNGSVRSTHQEFMVGGVSKATSIDGAAVGDHATHVGGTISAQGINYLVKGIAFNSSLHSYDWNGDLLEMQDEASNGLLVSNHSYGPDFNLSSQLWQLGAYVSVSRLLDELCYNNPFYLPVFAAGNSRNNYNTVPYSTQLNNKGGYDQIAGKAIAKNVMTVAAVEEVLEYTGAGSVVMSTFSSYGPTDDGRIKPDISMKGVNVRSTWDTSDTATKFESGTSMASPGITGVVLLLQQYYNQLYSNYMRAATVKGLILHSADEAGANNGPDYEFGWGLVNAENAAKIIRDKNLTLNRSIIEENVLSNGAVYTKAISSDGLSPLKISISWTDPQYSGQNNGTIDPPTKYLVNDLDVKVISNTGTTYYPWKLQGMNSPSVAASNNSTNDVDNFERVDISVPAGNYLISVSHKGVLASPQKYSLIVSGSNLSTLHTTDAVLKDKQIEIYPNPVGDWVNFKNASDGASIVILDISGKLLRKESLKDSRVLVKDLLKGQYMLIYTDKNNMDKSFKFIKL